NDVAGHEIVKRFVASACTRPVKSPGTFSIASPKKSLICVRAISTAIPLVNPTITGRGMYFIVVPRPVRPSRSKIKPAINVQMHKQYAILRDNAVDDNDECACRAADLCLRSA